MQKLHPVDARDQKVRQERGGRHAAKGHRSELNSGPQLRTQPPYFTLNQVSYTGTTEMSLWITAHCIKWEHEAREYMYLLQWFLVIQHDMMILNLLILTRIWNKGLWIWHLFGHSQVTVSVSPGPRPDDQRAETHQTYIKEVSSAEGWLLTLLRISAKSCTAKTTADDQLHNRKYLSILPGTGCANWLFKQRKKGHFGPSRVPGPRITELVWKYTLQVIIIWANMGLYHCVFWLPLTIYHL